jgi:RNA polymerase-interacting CarD/CdnL/TRCF family regulator
MTSISWGDVLAIVTIAGPLIAKALSDRSANASARHNNGLARITGMASREAATIARTLLASAANVDPPTLERALLNNAANAIFQEMRDSSALTGAAAPRIRGILQGEVDKIIAPAKVMPPLPFTTDKSPTVVN